MKKAIFLVVVCSFALSACNSESSTTASPVPISAQPAETAAAAPAPVGLGSLRQHLGKTPEEAKLWEAEPLNKRLSALLDKRYKTLKSNLQVAAPLREENGVLFLTGSKQARNSAGDVAALVIDPKQDLIFVWMKSGGKAEEAQENNQALALPGEVLKLMTGAKK